MKNKHLVLLFISVLVLGLLAKRLSWPANEFFQDNLIKVETARIAQISIEQYGQPDLLLEQTETDWIATQDGRTTVVRPEHIEPILAAITALHSIRVIKRPRLDTLGFYEQNYLRIIVKQDDGSVREFDVANETLENGRPASYVLIKRYGEVFLVENHLRGIFSKKLNDFRHKKVADFYPQDVTKIIFDWTETEEGNVQYPIFKNDSTGKWEPLGAAPPEISADSIQTWLGLFSRLNNAPFADYFDESRARETLLSQVEIGLSDADSLVFRLFYVRPPDLPEEISTAKIKTLPVYVLHSSQNPSNFFAPPDTHLLRQIFFMFKTPTVTQNDLNDK